MVRRRIRLNRNTRMLTLGGQPADVVRKLASWKQKTTERLYSKLKSQNLVGAIKPVLPKIKQIAPQLYRKIKPAVQEMRSEEVSFVKKIVSSIQKIRSILPSVSRRKVKGIEYIRIRPPKAVSKINAFIGSLREKMYAVIVDVRTGKPIGAMPVTKEKHLPAEKYEVKLVSEKEVPSEVPIVTVERGKIKTVAPPRKLPEEKKPKVTPAKPSGAYDFEQWLLSLDVCMAMLEAPTTPDFSPAFENEYNSLVNNVWSKYEKEFQRMFGEVPPRETQINPNSTFFRWLIENGYIIEESVRLPAERYSVEVGLDQKGEWFRMSVGDFTPTTAYHTPSTTIYLINGVPSIDPNDLLEKVKYETITTVCQESIGSEEKSRIVFVTTDEAQWSEVIGMFEYLKSKPESPIRGYLFIGIFIYPMTLQEYTPGYEAPVQEASSETGGGTSG